MDHAVYFPRQNSWSHYNQIHQYIDNVNDGDIVFVSLGPTARVACCDWFKLKPEATFIDCGSIFDPFTRDVWHRCHTGWENGFNNQVRCDECN
ncbi:MAG: GT-D fold domain-containing glycosyltransferase [Saprospiraceae bacterium]